jgi:predicted RNA binding protein YcfA (HicA-like mRNA interferase family)
VEEVPKMSDHLPVLSAREVVRAFEKLGFEVQPGRGKGSHIAMFNPQTRKLLTIPGHREVKRGMLRGLIREAGLTVQEFCAVL